MNRKIFNVTHAKDEKPLFTNYEFTLKCDEAGILNIEIMDTKGRSFKQKSIELKPGTTSLNMDISSLKKGKYNVWFNFKDQTVIKKIEVGPKRRTSSWKTLFY